METAENSSRAILGPRNNNACEACRSAKVKCQASNQLGICRRCLGSKRECVFRTGPRTRRPRQPKRPEDIAAASTAPSDTQATASHPPPPPGPSKTFTIDIPMPPNDDDDVVDHLEALRLAHEDAIDQLAPLMSGGDDHGDEYYYDANDFGAQGMDMNMDQGPREWPTPPSSTTTTSTRTALSQTQAQTQEQGGKTTTSTKPRTLATSLGIQPRFNLDSASKLLATFRKVMLGHFHCVEVSEAATVTSMAKEKPFVLLAILAAASGSRTLQGHSLYDEEFRKILGLKFVAGGERSLELLQGLLVYIAWYPFHLRPKSKQAFQYLRMVVDIVSDLELDQDPGIYSMNVPPAPERLEQIRLYLGSYYLSSSNSAIWNRTPSLTYTEYTARCCDLLEAHSKLRGDQTLVWQVRLQRFVEEANTLCRIQRGHSQSEYQISLMIRGMETELAEYETRMPPEIAATPSARISILFTRMFLPSAPLLKLPSTKPKRPQPPPPPTTTTTGSTDPHGHAHGHGAASSDHARILSAIPRLHALYEYFLSLPTAELNAFIGIEWAALILSVILGFRMSFPLADYPGWDDRAARGLVGFGEYLDRLAGMGDGGAAPAGLGTSSSGRSSKGSDGSEGRGGGGVGGQRTSMDLLSAMKIVLDMVKKKYLRRLARLEEQQAQSAMDLHSGFSTIPPAEAPGGRLSSLYQGCPMMDGSLEPYYPYWDETFASNLGGSSISAGGRPGGSGEAVEGLGLDGLDAADVQNDLWAAMTMGWAMQAGGNYDTQAL